MRGIAKAISRTPHMLTSKVGMAAKTTDAQYDDLHRKFTTLEKNADKLLQDAQSYKQAVQNMLLSGSAFGTAFSEVFSPAGSEGDFTRSFPQADNTVRSLPPYNGMWEELRDTLNPEVDLMESRVIGPIKDFNVIVKAIRKNITKRDHKLIDFDRHNNAYTKVKDKKEKSLKDEQNLFKLEQDFETAAADYEYFNNALKEQLPTFFQLATDLMTPLYHSFYYMQLNVLYLTVEKVQSFASGRYDLTIDVQTIENNYATQLGDAVEQLENLSIRKPAQASARVLGASRTGSLHAASSSSGGLAAGHPSRAASTASAAGSTAVSGKRAPPPPPGSKKPALGAAPKQYVVALYDYQAQAEGDLSFNAGDRIEVVERTGSAEDWWTGIVNGVQGIFPGNYVRDP